jgi:hypothetical protein
MAIAPLRIEHDVHRFTAYAQARLFARRARQNELLQATSSPGHVQAQATPGLDSPNAP